MRQYISSIALSVRDFDEAIAYYTTKLDFVIAEDRTDGARRWVLLSPPEAAETRIRLAKVSTPEQDSRVGNQTGGRVFLFLNTDDLWRDYAAMKARGVNFLEEPRTEAFGLGVIFADLYGNKWELVQPKTNE